jgi:hypothetical protein
MFFTLSKIPDCRFLNHHDIGNWVFSHDNGWYQLDENTWQKGYYHNDVDHGNFLKISNNNGKISISHDKDRSCPLWWDENTKILTNLLGNGSRLWADALIALSDSGIQIERNSKMYNIDDDSTISLDCLVDRLEQNFIKKFKALDRDYPYVEKKIFLTGGMDTTTLYSIIKNLKIQCEEIDYEHLEYDSFINLNFLDIKKQHWGYKQIHHWRRPCMLITGSCGDEFLFRGPYTIAMWAAWHDINIESLIIKSSGYHSKYFLLEKNLKIFRDFYKQKEKIKEQYPTRLDILKQIVNVNINDHQHWHLGNTLTWTPFKDSEILKFILRLDIDDLLQQASDAVINKKLIERFHPEVLKLVSNYKNLNSRCNLLSE